MTSTDSGPMPRLTRPDRLRWPVSPILYIALDADEQIVVEVLGRRASVPDGRDLAEAARQAHAAHSATWRPADGQVLAARTAELAARSRHDVIRRYIQAAAARQLADSNGRLGVDHYARDIADDAMTSIGSVLTQAIAAAADEVIRDLAGSPGWREVLALGVRHADSYHAFELAAFAREIAALSLTALGDGDRCRECEQDLQNSTVLDDLITRARVLSGLTTSGQRGDTEGGHLPAPAPGSISPNGHGPAEGK